MTKVQRYKVGYYTDEWGMSSNTPCLIPADSGYAVKFEDYCKLEAELAALKAENESLKRDAEQWRAYQKRKQDLLDRGFLRSPLREEAELNPAMAQGEK